MFLNIHPKQSATVPFYHSPPDDPVTHDKAASAQTIELVKDFDAAENILVCMAHDEVYFLLVHPNCSTRTDYHHSHY